MPEEQGILYPEINFHNLQTFLPYNHSVLLASALLMLIDLITRRQIALVLRIDP
jgi:hypothetical protein